MMLALFEADSILGANHVIALALKDFGRPPFWTQVLGRILLVPSLFSRLSSVFGRLQNPVLLVLSSKNGRFRRASKPSAS